MVSGIINIQPIWRALGEEKARALPVFHAFTRTDNVGKFSGISNRCVQLPTMLIQGRTLCWLVISSIISSGTFKYVMWE